eukprot:GHVL01006047.1.p1 GENE.GHVL01006047.1~~GHVL01006047.1.p1  ORF type:complete len:125 (+),score=10.89 GHVL01006047.1:116-490(+)
MGCTKSRVEFEERMVNEIIDSSNSVNVPWDCIGGLDAVKSTIYEVLVAPFLNKSLFFGLRTPPKGILLFGPPGNGKTMIAKAVASKCDAVFYNVSAASLTSKWLGDSEKRVSSASRILATIVCR